MPSGSAHEIAMLKVGERIAAALETIAKAWTEDNALKRQYAASLVRQPRTGALVSEEDEPVKPPPIGTPKPSMQRRRRPRRVTSSGIPAPTRSSSSARACGRGGRDVQG